MIPESRKEHKTFFSNAPVFTHSIDRTGLITSVSNAWAKELLYRPSEMIGKASVDFLMPASRSFALNSVLPQFFASGIITDIPYTFQRSDGSLSYITMSAGSLKEGGEIVRSMAIIKPRQGADAESMSQKLANFIVKTGIPSDVAKVITGLA